jgi:hypothetical protein
LRRILSAGVFVVVLLLVAACGGDDGTSTPASTSTTAATSTGTPGETATGTREADGTGTEEPGGTDTEEPEDTPTEPVDGDDAACNVSVTGDITQEYTGSGGSTAVGTDYWYTEDELRQALRTLAEFGSEDLSEEEIEAQVEEDMQKDPRFILLILNCVASDSSGSVTFSPSSTSKYADVPFEPKSYVIKGGQGFGGAQNPGEWSALFTLGESSFSVSADGTMNITKFDNSGIAGDFSFPAEEIFAPEGQTVKKVQVEGSFDFDCTGPSVCD